MVHRQWDNQTMNEYGATLISQALLREVAAEAACNPRRRKNRNLHDSDHAAAHRLFNALEPDSYVRAHRHLEASKNETIIALRGRFGIVLFDDTGAVVKHVEIAPEGTNMGIDIAHGTWHTAFALEPGSVFFEAKAGPYVPLVEAEKAAWAPAEGAPDAMAYLARLRALFA